MRLALLVLGTVVGLLVAEGGALLVERLGCTDVVAGFNVRNRLYGWGNRPGASGRLQRCLKGVPEWRTAYRFNTRGLRDREIADAPTDAFRILVLGDSFTAALQVDLAQSFPKRLEQHLQGVEVLNASGQGWGTDNELLYYRHEGWKYGADLVLLAFDTTNDVFENARALVATSSFWADKPYFALRDGRLALAHFPLPSQSLPDAALRRTVGALYRSSALVRAVAGNAVVLDLLTLPPPPRPADGPPVDTLQVYLTDYPPAWREAWRITRGLLLRLQREVEAHGSRFAVVVINAREEVSPLRWERARAASPVVENAACDLDKPNRLVTRFLERRGIPTIALLAPFRAAFHGDGSPGFFAFDMHWAPAGHELAAREIAAALRAHGLVPDRPTATSPNAGPGRVPRQDLTTHVLLRSDAR